jgi:hypothetical protein
MSTIGSNNIDTSLSNAGSFGYQELIGKKGEGGLGDRIAGAYQDVQDAMAKIKDAKNSGDPALLMDLQMKMNALTQILSTTTQSLNALKSSCEGANRNIG